MAAGREVGGADTGPGASPAPPQAAGAGQPPWRRRFNPWLLALAALPWLLIELNSNWFYAELTAIDTWIYFGFFHNLPLYAGRWFPQTYFGTRLSWILPGYAVHHLVPDVVVAHYVLHLGMYYAAVFSLYWILKQAVGSRSAVLGAVVFGCHTVFQNAMGWDYVDGPGLVYNLAALALAMKAARSAAPYGWLALAGAAGAAMVYCNLFLVLLVPFIPAFYLYLRLAEPRRSFLSEGWTAAFWMGGGALCLTVALALINHRLDRYFHFLRPALKFAETAGAKHHPGLAGLGDNFWLAFPAIGALGVIAWLVFGSLQRRFHPGHAGLLLGLNAVATAVLMLAFQIWHGYALEYDSAATCLVPSAFLGIGVVLALPQDRWKPAFSRWLIPALIAVLALALLVPGKTAGGILLPLPVIVACGAAGLAVKSAWPQSRAALVVALALLSVPHYRTAASLIERPGRADNADTLRRIRAGLDAVVARAGREPTWFWYNRNERLGWEFSALNACFLWLTSRIGDYFPGMRTDLPIYAGMNVVLLTSELSRDEMLRQANQALAAKGLRARPAGEARIERRGVTYDMYFVRLVRLRQPENLEGQR